MPHCAFAEGCNGRKAIGLCDGVQFLTFGVGEQTARVCYLKFTLSKRYTYTYDTLYRLTSRIMLR
jgi:hypothetical protein